MSDRWRIPAALGLCAVALAVGWWSKGRCITDGNWEDGEEYRSWCYTDLFALFYAERLDQGAVPYLDHPVEYPVLTGAQMYAGGVVTDTGESFFHVSAAINAAAMLGVVLLLARTEVPTSRLLVVAGLPTIATVGLVNWDAVPMLLMLAGILLHRRGRDGLAGVAVGLGVAAKLFPGLLIPIVVATRWRQGRRRDAAVHAGAAAGAWLAVNLPVMIAAPRAWGRFLELNRDRPADWDSLWYVAEQVRGFAYPTPSVNLLSLGWLLSGSALIVILFTRRHPPEEWWRLTLPLLAWFLLVSKVYSPQFSLWLVPLFALALPRLAPLAAFAVADLFVFAVRFPFLGGQIGLSPAPDYGVMAFALLVRAAMLLWIVADATLDLPVRAAKTRAAA